MKERVLIDRILAKHGARPDLRLWRNETAGAWVGKLKGRTKDGDIILFRGAQHIMAGLEVGSSDLIGIWHRNGAGIFLALEVKTENVITSIMQTKYLAIIESLGGIAAVVKSVEDVTAILGEPPK